MKRILSFCLVLFMLSALNVSAMALDQMPDDSITVTQFGYTVYDKDGNIVETGITPDFRTKYEWSGVTIENGQGVSFYHPDGRGFYILEGDALNVYALFNKNVSVKEYLSVNSSGSPGFGEVVYENSNRLTSGYVKEIDIERDGYYSYALVNASDGPIVVKQLKITW